MKNDKKSAPEEKPDTANKKQAFKEGNMDNTGKLNEPVSTAAENKNKTPGKSSTNAQSNQPEN